ncbi:alpha/beta-hydrolase [Trichoderma citrinoviride]|uniref:Alpha/beta-hydrolase n=1 Tax=Trichoderma citrinoviride TaxID=58853 RepID=A0A2T4BHX2_9HYPO|nr:alpha/beta-hydrolase [Trichoderma citrinoviride]PTB68913.1 alpha/beta-hydrolase [Trichoderma citrinoviride]
MASSSSPSSSSPVFDVREHTIQASHIREYPRATAVSQDEPLLLHVKQYTPKHGGPPRKGDITIIGAHANGFPKPSSHFISPTNIFMLQNNTASWLDYARDILHLINTFRPPRPLIAMGHSFGANALTNAALAHPRLFAGMVMLDPVIARFASSRKDLPSSPETYASPASLSAFRRDTWPSRDAAAAAFRSKAFYQSWDPRVLDLFIRYGLRDVPSSSSSSSSLKLPDETMQLDDSKHKVYIYDLDAELSSDSDLDPSTNLLTNPSLAPDHDIDPSAPSTIPFYRPEGNNTAARLPHLRPPVLYVFGATSTVSPPHLIREKLETTGVGVGGSGGARPGRVKHITHPQAGHLVPLEEPLFCAAAAAGWIKAEMDRWWDEEKEYEQWTRKPLEEKATLDDEFKKRLALPNRKGDKTKANL